MNGLPAPDRRPPSRIRGGGHGPAILGGLVLLAALALIPDLGPAPTGDPAIRLGHGRLTAIGETDPRTGRGRV